MIINSDSLQTLFTGFRAAFKDGFGSAPTEYRNLAMITNSQTAEETYGWLGRLPALREWIGDRDIKNIQTHGFTIKNRKFETSIEVERTKISDDNVGLYAPLFRELGRSSGEQPDKLIFDLLARGFTSLCYDGQYFFDTDHPVINADGSVSSASNMQAGSGPAWYLFDTSRAIGALVYQEREPYTLQKVDDDSDRGVFISDNYLYGVRGRSNAGFGLWQLAFGSKADLTPENYAAARAAMSSLRGDHGGLLGIRPNLLAVPTALEQQGRKIIKAALNTDGQSNIWQDTATLLVTPWLSA